MSVLFFTYGHLLPFTLRLMGTRIGPPIDEIDTIPWSAALCVLAFSSLAHEFPKENVYCTCSGLLTSNH